MQLIKSDLTVRNKKEFHHRGTEAQSFTLLTAPQAQLTIPNAFLCASVPLW